MPMQYQMQYQKHHWRERLHFLGYQLEGRQNITGSHWLHLSIPMEAMREVVAKVKQATAYPQAPEYDVFVNVNAIAHGSFVKYILLSS